MIKILLLSFSILFSHFSIEDNKVYNTISDKYYSDEEFINLLICDINFLNDDNFKKYKKSHTNLQFRKSWWTYLVLVGSWGAGIEGIRYPERWEEGGENYDPDDSNSPPGIDNIVFGTILYSSYYGYNKIRKDISLAYVINKYNDLYSKYSIEPIKIPYPVFDNFWTSNRGINISMGFSTYKTPVSFIDFSIIKYIDEQSEVYGTFGTLILTLNFGFGYQYYFKSRYESSPFVGISLNGSMFPNPGGGPSSYSSISFGFGKSIDINNFFKSIDSKKKKRTSPSFLNLGLVLSYSDINEPQNHEWIVMPMIIIEGRNSF